MELLWRVMILVVWIAVGLLIGRRYKRAGSAVLWFAVFGPFGLLLVAYGELRRAHVGPEPIGPAESQDLNLPVQVEVDGRWQGGTLQTWATTPTGWHAGCATSWAENSTQKKSWQPHSGRRFRMPLEKNSSAAGLARPVRSRS